MEGTAGPRSSANPTNRNTSQNFAVDYVGWVSDGEATRLQATGRMVVGTDGRVDNDGFVEWLIVREAKPTGDYRMESAHQGMSGWAFAKETWKKVDPNQIRSDWDHSVALAHSYWLQMEQCRRNAQLQAQSYHSTNDPNSKAWYAQQFHQEKRRWITLNGARQAEVNFQNTIRPPRRW